MSELVSITCSTDGTIHSYEFDERGIRPLSVAEVGKGVSAMALASPTRAYVAVKDGPAVVTLDLDEEGEAPIWREVARTTTEGHQTAMAISSDGRFLLGANYSEGVGAVWPILGDELGKPTARVEFANLHCVIAVDEHVYFVSLGDDLVAGYSLSATGRLEPLEVPTVEAPAGSGPRHVVASADGANLYVVTEFSGQVIRYSRDAATGQLTPRQLVTAHATDRGLGHSIFGADPLEHHFIWGADVHLVGDEWLVASERTESTLSVLPVASDGSLGEQVAVVGTQQQPRGFITSGDLVVCPGEKSDQVSLFRLDEGRLELVGTAPCGLGGNWARVH